MKIRSYLRSNVLASLAVTTGFCTTPTDKNQSR